MVQLGLIPPDHPLCAYSLTGYSGGGKKLIAEYQDPHRDPRHASARIYGTNLHHKHLPEMVHVCGLAAPPVFHPILGDYIQGMATTVLLRNDTLPGPPHRPRDPPGAVQLLCGANLCLRGAFWRR